MSSSTFIYSVTLSFYADPTELNLLELIGQGTYGRVHKAVWRGSIVAAKELPLGSSAKCLENELKVYRYNISFIIE